MCMQRDQDGPNEILTPCGICQERLYYWGSDVKCAITNKENKLIFKTLKEIQPYYWLKKIGEN